MTYALGITSLVYVLIAIGVFGTLTTPEVIGYGETAIAEAARPTLGDAGFTIMAIVALLSTAGCTNATLYASGNLTNQLAKAQLFPDMFGETSRARPSRRTVDHLGSGADHRQPRRSVSDRLGRQRRLTHGFPARRHRRLAAQGRHEQ